MKEKFGYNADKDFPTMRRGRVQLAAPIHAPVRFADEHFRMADWFSVGLSG
jgi:hypothetical protein